MTDKRIRMIKGPPLPPKAEWDFRGVEDQRLKFATLWEYARESDTIRNTVVRFLDARIDRSRTVRSNFVPRHEGERGGSADPVIVRKINELLKASNFPPSMELLSLVTDFRQDFPAPWLVRRNELRQAGNGGRHVDWPRIQIEPKTIGQLTREAGPGRHLLIMLAYYRHAQPFRIDWEGATVDSITAEFRRWVSAEAKNHPEMKRRGKPGHLPCEPLKWLSALRLCNAGFTYEQAQNDLVSLHDERRILPCYAEKSGWSDAIRAARQHLSKLESELASIPDD